MTRQSGITLVEVLVAILIMGVGLLAIFTLFPVGMLNYKQAMQDDRVQQAATNADAIAIARNIRHDPLVEKAFTKGKGVVFVDGFYQNIGVGDMGGSIPRCTITMNTPTLFPRWFALLDDFEFKQDGTPDGNAGVIQSRGYYTWAYLLRRPRANDPSFTAMAVVVYGGRTVAVAEGETTFPVSVGNLGETQLSVIGTPAITRTGWVLDLTPDATGNPAAQFYRIVSVTSNGTTTDLETQIPLKSAVTNILVMENVLEVIERGTGWAP